MKKKEEQITEYSKYSEDITPVKDYVARRHGNFIFLFEVKGYRGNDTGELYYGRDEALRMERIISMNDGQNGIESYFEIPQIIFEGQPLYSSAALSQVQSFSGATL